MDEKEKIDEEYRLIEENVGQNAELINKAFSRILNDNKKKDKINKDKNKSEENELETDLNNIKENKFNEQIKIDNEEVNNKLKPNDFLKMTMNILNN